MHPQGHDGVLYWKKEVSEYVKSQVSMIRYVNEACPGPGHGPPLWNLPLCHSLNVLFFFSASLFARTPSCLYLLAEQLLTLMSCGDLGLITTERVHCASSVLPHAELSSSTGSPW